MVRNLIFFVLLMVQASSFSQQPKKSPVQKLPFLQKPKELYISNHLVLDSSGIRAISKSPGDTIATDILTQTVYYCVPDSTESFWYKIFIEADCQVTFSIHPSAEDNIYNFFLYKHPQDISPEEIKANAIAPFRANLCKNEMSKDGTGLSISSTINFFDASSKTQVKDFYYTYYHAPIRAKKGEVLLLNVYHIKGTDCGYMLKLNSDSYSQTFKTIYKSCFSKETSGVNMVKKISAKEKKEPSVNNSAKNLPPKPAEAIFLVRDSSKQSFIDAEVAVVKPKAVAITKNEKGKFSFYPEKNTGYHLAFSAMGYKSFELFFITPDSAKSFVNEVYLTPCKEGDNFVMDKIYFYPNSPDMKPGSKPELEKLVNYLKENPTVCIEIQGHTNGNKRIKKSYEGNFSGSSRKLSQYRADVIKKYLVEKGISPERLLANGYGGNKMIFPNPKTQAQANKNIRVEVLLLSHKQTSLTTK